MITREDVSIGKILWDNGFGVGKVIHAEDGFFVMEFGRNIWSCDVGTQYGGKFDHCRIYNYDSHYCMSNLYTSYDPKVIFTPHEEGINWIPMEFLQSPLDAVIKLESGSIVTGFLDANGRVMLEDVAGHDDRPVFVTSQPIGWFPLDKFS